MQGITLPPTLVTPESGPPTAYLSGGATHYDIPHPRQLFAGSLTIKVPEDFDNIRDLRSLGLELPLIVFSLNLQAEMHKRYLTYHATLESQLIAEITQLSSQDKTIGLTSAEKQLAAIRQLIPNKRQALMHADTKTKLFPLRDPTTENGRRRNGDEFTRRMQKATSVRTKPSVVYTSFYDAVTATHERNLLTESLSRLEEMAIALSANIAADAEAKRIADEKDRVEAARIAAEAAKAEAARIAAERAETEAVIKANTYHASGRLAATSAAVITAAGSVASSTANFSLRAAISSAIGALAGFASTVATGFLGGVAALLYSPRLGDGELPQRYVLHTPLADLAPILDGELKAGTTATTVSLPYRISSRTIADGRSEVFVIKTDGIAVPSQVRVIAAAYDSQRKIYSATTADVPPRTLTWTPAANPGNASTTRPVEQIEAPLYTGATLAPVEVRIDSFPSVLDASFDDYVIVFPADSGLPPIYTMFRDRREDPGVATGQGSIVDESWSAGASNGTGVPIPKQIADQIIGQTFSNWRDYRETFWKAVGNDDFLSSQFRPGNINRLKKGLAPYVPSSEYAGARWVYELHHSLPISKGGEIYNAENIRITTPRLHVEIHKRSMK